MCASSSVCSADLPTVTLPVVGLDECDICQLVIKFAEQWLSKNATEAEIETFLNKVCAYLPISEDECETFVSAYVPIIVQWLESDEDPKTFCTSVGFCSSTMAAIAQAIKLQHN